MAARDYAPPNVRNGGAQLPALPQGRNLDDPHDGLPALTIDHDRLRRAITAVPLREIAVLIEALTYVDMVEFAEGLLPEAANEEREAKVCEMARRLHKWAGSKLTNN